MLGCKLIGASRLDSPAGRSRRDSGSLRLPSFAPAAFLACSAALVRSEISRRSFSANAAYRCSMNGSASRPSSATMNGTRWAIRPATNATSRDSRSSLDTTTLHLAFRAAANAAASCGRRSRASAPFPVSASVYSLMMVRPSACREALDGRPLGFYAEARALLSLGGNSKICDSAFH